MACVATAAAPQTWRFEPSIGLEETLTNNVKLEANDLRHGDLVTQFTPGFRFSEQSAHTQFAGTVSLPILIYARTSSENQVQPNVNVLGTAELIPRLFFIEGSIVVDQQYLTPFGARSDSLANATNNRYTSQTYRLSPYIKGSAGTDLDYELRDNNIWTKGNSNVVNDAYTNELIGSMRRVPRPWGWSVDLNRSSTKFQDQSKQLLELVRLSALYQVDPQIQLSARTGFEHNDLLLESQDDVIYGVGIKWRPTERARAEVSWEHRFFGSAYDVLFDNRTPLSVSSLTASRNISTYPQQLASLPGGVDVAAALNQIFQSSVSDPQQRQALVNQLITDRGLPQTLSGPVTLYAQTVQLTESLIATAGILGARNSVFFSLFRIRVEPISGSGNPLPPELDTLQNNTQYGGNIVWSQNVTPQLALTASIDAGRTKDNVGPGSSKQGSVRLGFTTPLSPVSSLYGGVRYQAQRSNTSNDYSEAAVFVGFNHQFK